MPRPLEFDRGETLLRAMEVFWTRGYEGAGMPQLVEAMGIGRQSLYNEFESKRGLFLEALERYQDERAIGLAQALDSAKTPLGGVEALLLSIATATGVARSRGCLSVNTAAELGSTDAGVAEILKKGARRSKRDLRLALAKAKAAGEVPAQLDEGAGADFILTVMRGLRLDGRAGATGAEMRNSVRIALVGLRNLHRSD